MFELPLIQVAACRIDRRHWLALALLASCVGCHGAARITPDPRIESAARLSLRQTLPIFGNNGRRATWRDLLNAAADAEVIILGEQHDDATAHAAQLAFFEDAAAQWPDARLSMEMLDRRRQAAADDYVAEIIDREQFLHEIATTKFRTLATAYLNNKMDRATFAQRIFRVGWPDWERNYQPIIDVARANKLHIIAANTPWRRYGSLANHDGFARLDSLTAAQRRLVEIPQFLPEGTYRQRFEDVMTPASRREPGAPKADLTPERSRIIAGAYRAQCVMDATMADSIADAIAERSGRIVHLVGQFHSDFDGGLVQQLRRLHPGVRVLTISFQSVNSDTLREEDRDRAAFVVYTQFVGERDDSNQS